MKKNLITAYFVGWMLYGAFSPSYHNNLLLGIGIGFGMPGFFLAFVLAALFGMGPNYAVIYGASALFWIVLGRSKRRLSAIAVRPAPPTIVRTAWRRRTRTYTEN